MNSYERVMAVLNDETPDILPVGPFLSNHAAYIAGVPLSEYYCDGKLMGRVLYEAWERYGYDMIFAQSDNYYIAEGLGVETKKEGNNLPLVTKTIASTFREAAQKVHVPDPYTDGRMPVYLEAIDFLKEKVKGKVAIRGTGTGMFSLFSHMYGLQDFLCDVSEMHGGVMDGDEDAIEEEKYFFETMEVLTETLIRFHKAEIEAGADIVHMGDSLGSMNVISPDIFRRYVYPYLKKYFDAMQPYYKEHKAYGLLHICGNNSVILDDFISLGADIYEMDYKMDPKTTKERVAGRMTLLGNINPAELVNDSVERIEEMCQEVISAAAPGGKFILGTGCETGYNTPIENIHAMVKVGHSYKYDK